ncbi:MAG: hypothetical protein IKZ87_05015 [Actinomycetaceae bacterium]|nr:hypothetical protein [Actinomycetaceae bacterium]
MEQGKQEIEVTIEMKVYRTFKVQVTGEEMESVREDAWVPNLEQFQQEMLNDSKAEPEWDWRVCQRHEDGVYETIVEFNRD